MNNDRIVWTDDSPPRALRAKIRRHAILILAPVANQCLRTPSPQESRDAMQFLNTVANHKRFIIPPIF